MMIPEDIGSSRTAGVHFREKEDMAAFTICADNNETIDELDETNNCVTNIWMCGNVNSDGKVTMSDVRKVLNRYLDPGYELNCCCEEVG